MYEKQNCKGKNCHFGLRGSRMLHFAESFSNEKILSTLSKELTWSHFVEILPIKDELAREFYTEN